MPKTLSECHGVDEAAFLAAAAKLDALRKVRDQATHIEEFKAKYLRDLAREIQYMNEMRAAAEKLGAYELIEVRTVHPVASMRVVS